MRSSLKSFLYPAVRLMRHWRVLLRRPRYNAKVFCVGYNKTGTTTIGKSFELLGLRNLSFNERVWRDYYKKGKLDKVIAYVARFESTDDLPFLKAGMIPLLDKAFPGSKFVYLRRDEQSWMQSMENWAMKVKGKRVDMDEALRGYRNHKAFIAEYFDNWPADRFLALDIRDENGFKKLAGFLNIPTERNSFPHFNRTADVK